MKSNLISEVCDSLIPLFKELFDGRVAIGIAGSVGKNKIDEFSDIDFRLYYDKWIDDNEKIKLINKNIDEVRVSFSAKGIKIDGYFPKKIENVENELNDWIIGEGNTPAYVWTIWGYHPMSDLINQYSVYDPEGLIQKWHDKLKDYPDKLRINIISKHLNSAQYWRDDYHYFNKVKREDVIFSIGIASKVLHNLIQVLFALNKEYYVGDGKNAEYLNDFSIIPNNFIENTSKLLLPEKGLNPLLTQRSLLVSMINDVEELVVQQQINLIPHNRPPK